jgi:hypothetical protein
MCCPKMETPEDLRRSAAEMEATARQISLRSDRAKLLAIALRMRREAEALEAKQRERRPE